MLSFHVKLDGNVLPDYFSCAFPSSLTRHTVVADRKTLDLTVGLPNGHTGSKPSKREVHERTVQTHIYECGE